MLISTRGLGVVAYPSWWGEDFDCDETCGECGRSQEDNTEEGLLGKIDLACDESGGT